MKWVFLALLALVALALSNSLRSNRRLARPIAVVMGLLTFSMAPLHLFVAPISWAMWPGYVKGLEVSLLDAVALAVIMAAPARGRGVGMKAPLLLLIAAAVLSMTQSQLPMASFFYAWQLARMFLVFCAVAMLCRDEAVPEAFVKGMVIGIAIQAVVAAYQSVSGAVQTGGSFGHQNQLGMMTHLVLFPALALLLGGRRGWVPIVGPLAGVMVAILTASRGTIGFAAIGIALLILLSMARRPSGRKGAVVTACLVALAVAAPLAVGSLDRRFEQSGAIGDYDERAAFERAAQMIVADHPMGVGANEYVIVANTAGYSGRAGVIAVFGSRSAHVHNAFLLAAAEMGYFGMAALILALAWPAFVAIRFAWRRRRDPEGELMLGCAVALIIVALHSMYEWIFVTFHTQYPFAIVCGMIAGVVYRPRRRTNAAPASDMTDALTSVR